MVGNGSSLQASEKPVLIWNEAQRVGDWAKARIPYVYDWSHGYRAIGMERHGTLCAAVIFDYYTIEDIAMHVASEGRNWLTRSFLRAGFGYPFIQLKVRRVTGYVALRNIPSRRLVQHLGFRLEGVKKDALRDDDLCIYGMTRRECRFIGGPSG
jgi:hypothetical protein